MRASEDDAGAVRGGAVRLPEPSGVLMVGEGIETCLAAVRATGHVAWAALSTSGLRSVDPPKDVGDVIVLADGDEAGEALEYGRFEYLAETFDVLASLAVSAREAARRHNASLLEIHAKEARAALIEALEVRRLLGAAPDEAGR